MTKTGTRFWQIVGACVAAVTLAGAIYSAVAAARLYDYARRETDTILFRMPVELGETGVHRSTFHVELKTAHGVVFLAETDAVSEARQSVQHAVEQVGGTLLVANAREAPVYSTTFSSAEPLMRQPADGNSTPQVLWRPPDTGPYTLTLHLTQPASQPAQVQLVGRYAQCGLERAAGFVGAVIAVVLLLVSLATGVPTALSILRARGKSPASES